MIKRNIEGFVSSKNKSSKIVKERYSGNWERERKKEKGRCMKKEREKHREWMFEDERVSVFEKEREREIYIFWQA